jgi:hypothetical protein
MEEEPDFLLTVDYEDDPENFIISIGTQEKDYFTLNMDQEQFEDVSKQMIKIIQQANLRKANEFRERQKQLIEGL